MLNEPCKGFGDFIQSSRRQNNLSVDKLAAALGVSTEIVDRLEKELVYPSQSLILKLSLILEVDESKLTRFIWCEDKECGNPT